MHKKNETGPEKLDLAAFEDESLACAYIPPVPVESVSLSGLNYLLTSAGILELFD